MKEILPQYEVKIKELEVSSRELAGNSATKAENDRFIDETQAVQNDFNAITQSVKTAKSK